jgi:hypothetical protein
MSSHSKICAELRPKRIAALIRSDNGMLRSMASVSESDNAEANWIKSGFIDGNRNLWYNNVTREMEWRKPDVWEAGSNFRMESFIAEYGSAYFLTALSLSAMSFSTAYLLVTKSGVNLDPILSMLGIGAKPNPRPLCPLGKDQPRALLTPTLTCPRTPHADLPRARAGPAAGTLALAFALHKAASPVRLPLGVALTPIVASAIGTNAEDDDEPGGGSSSGAS